LNSDEKREKFRRNFVSHILKRKEKDYRNRRRFSPITNNIKAKTDENEERKKLGEKSKIRIGKKYLVMMML